MFDLHSALKSKPAKWLVTGAAGFIGSNLCIALIDAGHTVLGLDNLATGQRRNISDIEQRAELSPSGSFRFIEADICDFAACQTAVKDIDYVLHQAALGSVPRSIGNPIASHQANVNGFLNMIYSASNAKVKRFVYASSSSVYGDSQELPKVEQRTGNVLSPYAATKAINEVYAGVIQRTYGMECVGLRYFNVFGARQDPNGQYAAVIPRWLLSLLKNEAIIVNGDGTTSRDFCYIDNVVQANLRAALRPRAFETAEVFNIAFGQRTTLLELASELRESLATAEGKTNGQMLSPVKHVDFRAGDVLHSLADISHAQAELGYAPTHSLAQGLSITSPWYFQNQDRLI